MKLPESTHEQGQKEGIEVPATLRNRVVLLNNGARMYAALIRALQQARHTIALEYYIFDDDRIGRAISEVLMRRARAGVRVYLIYDPIGSWLPPRGVLRRLRSAGVQVRYFRPYHSARQAGLSLWGWLNVRDHHKLALIDGRLAFLGGINIARRYLEGNALGRWRDEHLQIEGEAVEQLQHLFLSDWLAVGGEPIALPRCRPPHDSLPRMEVQLVASREGATRYALEQALVALIDGAQEEILASSPYFIPTPALQEALLRALKRGVRLRLMLPLRTGIRLVEHTAPRYCEELLRHGAEIYGYKKGFLHTKQVVADRRRAYSGTANLDYRSLWVNWEVGLVICSARFARHLALTFERDCKACRPLALRQVDSRGVISRLWGALGYALRRLL